jgi:hypothetical protein
VLEDAASGFCGAVLRWERGPVVLEDRHGNRRTFALGAGFWYEGRPSPKIITDGAVSSIQIQGSQDQHRATDQHGGSARGKIEPEGLGRYRGTTTCGLKGSCRGKETCPSSDRHGPKSPAAE